jgi:uncharacterized protein (DUF433 family)
MTTTIDIGTLIVKSPDICNNRPRIVGTRMTVHNIIIDHQSGISVEEIAQERSHLNLAQIYAALAYYYANQAIIDAEIQSDQEEYELLKSQWMKGQL